MKNQTLSSSHLLPPSDLYQELNQKRKKKTFFFLYQTSLVPSTFLIIQGSCAKHELCQISEEFSLNFIVYLCSCVLELKLSSSRLKIGKQEN